MALVLLFVPMAQPVYQLSWNSRLRMPLSFVGEMDDRTTATERRHWFYGSKILVCAFCLAAFVAIFWEVSQFEGFQPIFRCDSANDIDRWLLSSGMEVCMG